MLALTNDLKRILKDHFQAAAQGFRARVLIGTGGSGDGTFTAGYLYNAPSDEGGAAGRLTLAAGASSKARYRVTFWITNDVLTSGALRFDGYPFVGGQAPGPIIDFTSSPPVLYIADEGSASLPGISFEAPTILEVEYDGSVGSLHAKVWQADGIEPDWMEDGLPTGILAPFLSGLSIVNDIQGTAETLYVTEVRVWLDDVELGGPLESFLRPAEVAGSWDGGPSGGADLGAWDTVAIDESRPDRVGILEASLALTLHPKHISIDKSARMLAAQATVEFANEDLALGFGPTSSFPPNTTIRIEQWYGDPANAVRTFTGLVDRAGDHRDMLTTTLTCRDRFALLIDQTFSTIAPQADGDAGADRTPDNGVYLGFEVSAIVTDITDRAGWPPDDRVITPTSFVIDEFIIADGSSWADAIVGESALTGVTGYRAWADAAGIFHFEPDLATDVANAPVEPSYTFRSGEDLVSLDDTTDQYVLRTRVKVRGPMVTTTIADAWTQLWRTTAIKKPVGIWFDPADAANIEVLSAETKRVYKLRQSDRHVLSSVYLGSVIPYPLGISGDPADASIYWVLNAPWYYTGSTAGNSVKKVRKSDHHVLHTYALPDGRWSAIKVSAAYAWLTNLDTDHFYARHKSSMLAHASYRHTYASVLQSNPSGIMVDGTTLSVFWSNGGTTARFLVCDESDPGTVIKVVKTAGTALHGGEMDTLTHTECWGDSDALGLVAKFTLVSPVSGSVTVGVEAVDVTLEDELGARAGTKERVHDAHPDAAPHAYEVRRETIDLKLISSPAQAADVAAITLAKLAHPRRVLDFGIVGHPGLEPGDYIRVEDPVAGLAEGFLVDTYRTDMAADGTYLGTGAGIPTAVSEDLIVDVGVATEPPVG